MGPVTKDQIDRLFKRFQKLDTDGSGGITKEELMEVPEISMNPLLDRLIQIFDVDGTNDIDFEEFVTALSVFSEGSTRDEKTRCEFIVINRFSIYVKTCNSSNKI